MGKKSKQPSIVEQNVLLGREIIEKHALFGPLVNGREFYFRPIECAKGFPGAACVTPHGNIKYNKTAHREPQEWAYIFAHLMLHLCLGQANPDHVSKGVDLRIWNIACDIFVTKFLHDVKFPGEPETVAILEDFMGSLRNEKAIYEYLCEHREEIDQYTRFSVFGADKCDIDELDTIWDASTYRWQSRDHFEKAFSRALQGSVRKVLRTAGSPSSDDGPAENLDTEAKRAALWFINSYPLLGGLAAHFKVKEDALFCMRNEISIAAIDVDAGEIYVNPAAGLKSDELKFVLAHEYLHAGLGHARRRTGRDPELWNVACDFVINGWLTEMRIGTQPQNGTLYDESLAGMSAEEIYDELVRNIRTSRKLQTLRGYGKGDIIGKGEVMVGTVTLDEYCKSALMQGLEYHLTSSRGRIPAGLIEEIRALAMPPIPWDVQLAKWFDDYFAPVEKVRTYARPSRRQASTPDIPRPRYYLSESQTDGRTFGVVIDTSGSMSAHDIGIALGAIASYADAKDVPKMRVVFCDAEAYDAGYLSPEDVAGRVQVQGRGGTVLQPGVDLLETSKTFPKDGPILIITDGAIEDNLVVKRSHAFLIPNGKRLPFRPKGKVFYYS